MIQNCTKDANNDKNICESPLSDANFTPKAASTFFDEKVARAPMSMLPSLQGGTFIKKKRPVKKVKIKKAVSTKNTTKKVTKKKPVPAKAKAKRVWQNGVTIHMLIIIGSFFLVLIIGAIIMCACKLSEGCDCENLVFKILNLLTFIVYVLANEYFNFAVKGD